MNRIFAVISGGFLLSQQMANPAHAYIDRWSVTDSYTDIVAADCGDCEEDLGIIIACTGNGQPARITVNAAAAESGNDGAIAPVIFSIDGQQYVRQAKTIYFGKIGYTPEFEVAYDDPLIPALQRGRVANITFNDGGGQINLKGSRKALDTFKAHCGWTAAGFQINLARNAAQNTQQVTAQQPQLPVFGQNQQQTSNQPAQLPVIGQTQQQVQGSPQPQGQLPVINQQPAQQTQGQLPVLSQNPQPVQQQPQGQLPVLGQTQQQAQPSVYGVAPGQVHTQPNANGELWFTSTSNTGPQLWYGIPESDAVAVSASCKSGSPQPVSLDLLVGTGNYGNGQQARIEFLFDGQTPFGLNGTTFIENEEYSGVRISVTPTAPFWRLISSSHSVSLGIQGQPKITIPGAGRAGQFFISKCGSIAGQAQQLVQQPVVSQQPVLQQPTSQLPVLQQPAVQQQVVQQFPQPQQQQIVQQPLQQSLSQQPVQQQPKPQQQVVQQPAQQPVQQLPVPQVAQKASVEPNRTFNVTCANGSSWKIRFENRQSKTVAILHPGLPQQLILEPVTTPTGQGYRNGPLTVYPEGNQLRSDNQGNVSSCPMR